MEQVIINMLLNKLKNKKLLSAIGQQNSPDNGKITGGASNFIEENDDYNPIEAYKDTLRQQGLSDEIVNGVEQGLNYGNQNIAQWQEQYNNGAGRNNPIRIPKTEEEVALARQGQFNVPAQQGNVTTQPTLIDKIANGLNDIKQGYQENLNNGFAPENLQSNQNKNTMNRIGEFAGTVNRVSRNPIVQGLVGGALSTALTGNPMFGAMVGTGMANAKQMSQIYQNALKKHGVDVGDLGSFGAIGQKSFSTLMQPEYKEAVNNIALAKLEEAKLQHELLNQYKQKELEIKQQNANTNEYKAKNGTTINHVGGGSKSGGSKTSPLNQEKATQSYANDLAEYYNIYQSGNLAKINYAKQQFLKRHKGINPDKELGL